MERDTANMLVKVIAWLYMLSGIIALAVGFALVFGAPALFQLIPGSGFMERFGSGLAFAIGLVLLALALLDIIIAVGLLNHREWARKGALAIAVFNLFSFPFGTLTGILALFVLGFDETAKPLFELEVKHARVEKVRRR